MLSFLRSSLFMLSCCLSLLLFSVPANAAEDVPPPAEWTIMAYISGDNNLEYHAIMDILEMEQSLPQQVEVIVLFDRHKGYTKLYDDWTGARLYRLKKAAPFAIQPAADNRPNAPLPPSLASELLEDWGEVDMADPATLTRFITTVAERFPARRYALLPWNHGGGWPALIQDEDGGKGTPGKGMMTIAQFIEAANLGAMALPRKRFDLLKYDMCLMGQLDVMAATAPIADYAYASPPVEPGQSSDYLNVLPLFQEGVSTKELTQQMVDINVRYFTRVGRPAAFAAYDLSHMDTVTERLRTLTTQLRKLAPSRFKELTRATCFATHYEDLTEDLKRGKNAYSSVVLEDWLSRLEHEVPDAPKDSIQGLREAVAKLVYASGATADMQTSKGVTLYIPLRREYENAGYRSARFANDSGMASYLSVLYTAQDTLGDSTPRITNVQMGAPKLKAGRDGSSDGDFDIKPIAALTPFSRNVIRFDVTGIGILMTHLLNFEERGKERYLNYIQLVGDATNPGARKDSGNALNDISPVYNDGTTPIMREVGVKYKVTNGQTLGDITIINTSASRELDKNVSVGFGLYRDPTTGGRDIPIQVTFSNLLRMPVKTVAYQVNAQGVVTGMRGIDLRPDGFFRPAVSVLDASFKERRVYGPPLSLAGGTLLLTVDMLDEGSQVGFIIQAQTMNGKNAHAIGPTLPVRRDRAQEALRTNALRQGGNNLAGRYAMIQLATSGNDLVVLPTFQTIRFTPGQTLPRWELFNGNKPKASGPMVWLDAGLPQISLHTNSSMPNIPLGQLVQTWYAFLKGQGPERLWYCIGMGDGTRWIFVPLEQYEGNPLEGVWTSATERWEFKGNTVQLTRDGQTGKGTFTLDEHILHATAMPAPEYAVYVDQEHGRMTLITRQGVASFLTREGNAKSKTQQTISQKPSAQHLVGNWISGPETGYARLSIVPVPGTSFFNMRLQSQGQGEIVCTFAVSGQQLLASFRDGSRAIIRYLAMNNHLTLFFPKMPEIRFSRQ